MALIDFKCGECGKKFYELVTSADKSGIKCPSCSSHNVKQIYEGKACFGAVGKSASSEHKHSGG